MRSVEYEKHWEPTVSNAEIMELLEQLAETQGRLQACEEIIARAREGCDPDVVGATISTRRVLDMLGPEPTS